MANTPVSIPRPLVRTNQWSIVLSVLASWLTGEAWILAIPLLAGIMGLLFGYNPIMRAAKLFLRKNPADYIPEDWEQQQFNQVIAVACLALGLISFLLGWTAAGYVFTAMVALSALVAILGFCIGCFIRFQLNQYKYRKSYKA
ncbi:DUF4395 domain-containing protein [Cytobacillus oceanisediminis]|uniref:DUF4395 domain-containing protein n=1 Tax=Cytobacillus TaxID=2675230 RepID=UPI0020416F2A|nr:DUF4395 domain-containing protein [Cytobacillus oceanisediminis]MBY0157893.1 DUF4395 domain-containing protein [Cytobacillus firmus]MCM3532239.1 DUF4395 domain-containing protein [Cytobacillus oceanisediminis]